MYIRTILNFGVSIAVYPNYYGIKSTRDLNIQQVNTEISIRNKNQHSTILTNDITPIAIFSFLPKLIKPACNTRNILGTLLFVSSECKSAEV